MDRAAGLVYIQNQYGSGGNPLLPLAGLGVTLADSGPVQEMLNDAFLYAGVDYDDLGAATVANALLLRACIRFSVISWALANLNQLELIGVLGLGEGVEFDSQKWRERLVALQQQARVEAIALGAILPNPATDGVSYPEPIRYPLDYLQQLGG